MTRKQNHTSRRKPFLQHSQPQHHLQDTQDMQHVIGTVPSDAPHISVSIHITPQEVDEIRSLLGHIKERVFPGLQDIQAIQVERFYQSTSNRVFRCSHDDKHVMVRIYGEGASLLVNRDKEVNFSKAFGKHRLTAEVYATFENGYVVEYIFGKVLTLDQMRSAEYGEKIAKKAAVWHKTEPKPFKEGNKQQGVWHTIYKWIKTVREIAPEEDISVPVAEIELLEKIAKKFVNKKLVLGHNDLNYGNMIHEVHDEIFFVDYEYAGYNYRAFDLGNHFCEYAGVSEMEFDAYPNEATRTAFLRHYLETMSESGKVDPDELASLLIECECYSQVSHLFWHIWAIVIAHTPNVASQNFDYKDYAMKRLGQYFKRKQVLQSVYA